MNASAPLLFFIHGWPDNAALWRAQIEHFSKRYACAATTLPAYGGPEDLRSGMDFPQLVDSLAEEAKRAANGRSVVLIGHDWGAYLTYLLDSRHPQLATRLITMDVGARLQPENLGHALFLISYQWWLIAAHFIGKGIPAVGNAMSRAFAKYAKAPRYADITARMNYPYFYYWRARFLKQYAAALPVGYRPKKPLLYLFGGKKKHHFHSKRWLEILAETPGSKVVELPCDHWLSVRKPAETNALIEQWLAEGQI